MIPERIFFKYLRTSRVWLLFCYFRLANDLTHGSTRPLSPSFPTVSPRWPYLAMLVAPDGHVTVSMKTRWWENFTPPLSSIVYQVYQTKPRVLLVPRSMWWVFFCRGNKGANIIDTLLLKNDILRNEKSHRHHQHHQQSIYANWVILVY